jgi:hypothetical protein
MCCAHFALSEMSEKHIMRFCKNFQPAPAPLLFFAVMLRFLNTCGSDVEAKAWHSMHQCKLCSNIFQKLFRVAEFKLKFCCVAFVVLPGI